MGVKRHLVALVASLWVGTLAAQELKPFTSGSYREIVEARADRPFLLAFWSIDCPPCYGELEMLGELRQKRRFDLVLVSTDGVGSAAQVKQVLQRSGLEEAEAWIVTAPIERVRFEVDRTWYGELPRSYLFGHDRQRRAVSGRIEEAAVSEWLQSVGN